MKKINRWLCGQDYSLVLAGGIGPLYFNVGVYPFMWLLSCEIDPIGWSHLYFGPFHFSLSW